MQTIIRLTKVLFFVSIILMIGLLGTWVKFLYTPLITDDLGVKYTVREGAAINTVIDDLYGLNIINHPSYFKMLVRMDGSADALKAGEYLFPKGTTPQQLLMQITTGTGIAYYAFTIIPGWTFKDVKSALNRNEHIKHTISNLTDTQIMTLLDHPEIKPEGEFYPDTYFFNGGTEDIALLKKSFKTMQTKLGKAWESRDADLPFKTPYEVLIAASIIEKEAYYKAELPKIAGVMVNRLKRDMRLQFDPTVIYGVGENYDGKIHKKDLTDKNPYNTYVNKGLPPTPISMPGPAAIEAAVHPAKHDYYYFVAHNNGESQFSQELTEHNKAVAVVSSENVFFNTALIERYYLKLFSQNAYQVN